MANAPYVRKPMHSTIYKHAPRVSVSPGLPQESDLPDGAMDRSTPPRRVVKSVIKQQLPFPPRKYMRMHQGQNFQMRGWRDNHMANAPYVLQAFV